MTNNEQPTNTYKCANCHKPGATYTNSEQLFWMRADAPRYCDKTCEFEYAEKQADIYYA